MLREFVSQAQERRDLVILETIAFNGFDIGGEDLGHRVSIL
jgi:hypothetical protein